MYSNAILAPGTLLLVLVGQRPLYNLLTIPVFISIAFAAYKEPFLEDEENNPNETPKTIQPPHLPEVTEEEKLMQGVAKTGLKIIFDRIMKDKAYTFLIDDDLKDLVQKRRQKKCLYCNKKLTKKTLFCSNSHMREFVKEKDRYVLVVG